MSPQDYATLAVAVCTVVGAFATAVRWLVKHYLYELKKNGGSSMRDDVITNTQRLERVEKKQDQQSERIDDIYRLLCEK